MAPRRKSANEGAKAPKFTNAELYAAMETLAKQIHDRVAAIERVQAGIEVRKIVRDEVGCAPIGQANVAPSLSTKLGNTPKSSAPIVDRLCELRTQMRETLDHLMGFSGRMGFIPPELPGAGAGEATPESRDLNSLLSDLEHLRFRLAEHVSGVASQF